MVHQQRKVYSAENSIRGVYVYMPNIRRANSKTNTIIHKRKWTYIVGKEGIEKVVSQNGNAMYSYPNGEITFDDIKEPLEVKLNTYYTDVKYKIYNQKALRDETVYTKKDKKALEKFWNRAVWLVEKYPNNLVEVQWNENLYKIRDRWYKEKDTGEMYRVGKLDYSITVRGTEVNSFDKEMERYSHYSEEIKNEDYRTTTQLEDEINETVSKEIFKTAFYKKYFKPLDIELKNSYKGSSFYRAGKIELKKWACDKTLLHEIAHQGRGCSNSHDEYFTSQMLMLVGRYLGHDIQIELETSYRNNDVHWLGNFFHSEKCLKDLGITDEVLLKRNKGNKVCATGETKMSAKFNNHLSKKVARAKY